MLYSIGGKEQTEVPQRRLEQWNQWTSQISKRVIDELQTRLTTTAILFRCLFLGLWQQSYLMKMIGKI